MTPSRRRALILALTVSAVSGPALAHHSFGMFDAQKSVTLEGAVKAFEWTNPHVWIEIAVTDSKGATVDWAVEGASAAVLSRQGWSRKAMKPGDKVSILIHPAKDGTAGGSLVSATVNGQPVGTHG